MLDSLYYFRSFQQIFWQTEATGTENKALNRLIRFPSSLSMRHLEAGLATLQGVKPQGVWII